MFKLALGFRVWSVYCFLKFGVLGAKSVRLRVHRLFRVCRASGF